MEPFSALVLCDDRVALGIVIKILEEYDFKLTVTDTALAADLEMRKARFDLAVFDNDIPEAIELTGRKASVNTPKMVFAIMPIATAAKAQGKRIHFVVQKPIVTDLFSRSLRAAFGIMLKERRAAFRHLVQIVPSSCFVMRSDGQQDLSSTTVLDISQTGLCFQANELLTSDAIVRIRFQLPETEQMVQLTGTVVWVRASGRTGLRFTDTASEQQKILNDWLDTLMPYTPLLSRPAIAYLAR